MRKIRRHFLQFCYNKKIIITQATIILLLVSHFTCSVVEDLILNRELEKITGTPRERI